MSFLVTCRDLFDESNFPVTAVSVSERPLLQTDLHRHEFFEMLYVAQGTLINRLTNDEMTLEPGDLLVIKPYVQHLLTATTEEQDVRAFCCSFLPQIVDSSILGLDDLRATNSPNKYFFRPFLSLTEDDVSAVRIKIPASERKRTEQLFQDLLGSASHQSEGDSARTRCSFLKLLSSLADDYPEDPPENDRDSKPVKISTSRYHKGLRKSLNHIHEHFAEPLTLQAMAEISGVSVSYFSMLIKHTTGMSFINYLTGLRMDQACSLLTNTTENIMEICYQVGFNDYSNFSKQFKKATGMTPRDYRSKTTPK